MVAKITFGLLQRSVSITNFVIGYDIEICVTVFFINNQAMFHEESNSTSGPS